MSRCALWVWYRGTTFRGFQRQAQGPTVQEALERALGGRTVMPAGRTDLGVHARMQVVSVALPAPPPAGTISPDLGIAAAVASPKGFHAQWSAIGKEYRYRFAVGGAETEWAWAAPGDVRPDKVQELLGRCEGTHDFIAFHEKSSVRKRRTIESARLHERGGGVFEVRLRGDSFGRYQVRYLVGSALAVAAGLLSEERFLGALERGEPISGLKAPAHGLTLWEVRYPAELDPFRGIRPVLPDLDCLCD